MKKKRCYLPIAALFLLANLAFGQGIRGLESVYLIQTSSIDIYYPRSLESEARRLSAFADETRKNLQDFLGVVDTARIPVLLSDSSPYLNGYSTSFPSRRIVIFLAPADPRGELANFSDDLKSVFTHELTHALTQGMRSPFWAALAFASGDWICPTTWIMPQAMEEGLAVFTESSGGEGRLNDPHALRAISTDMAAGIERGIWDVSGGADYPGSGDLPYVYGGMFYSFIMEKFGPAIQKKLWSEAAAGNFIAGFDSVFPFAGAFEKATGMKARKVWGSYLSWMAAKEGSPTNLEPLDGSWISWLPVGTSRIATLASVNNKVYYNDGERNAVFSLDARVLVDAVQGAATRKTSPERLFDADSNIERLLPSNDGSGLFVDWVRFDKNSTLKPATYFYDFGKHSLTLSHPALADANGIAYNLVKSGERTLPSRKGHDGGIEVLSTNNLFVRSLTVDTGARLAMSVTPELGNPTLAILFDTASGPELYVQKRPFPCAITQAAFTDANHVAFVAEFPNGKQALGMMRIDAGTLATFFDALPCTWVRFDTEKPGADAQARGIASETNTDVQSSEAIKVLFPLSFQTVRYPVFQTSSSGLAALGLHFQAKDITERLSWSADTGWNWEAGLPIERISLRLSTGSWIWNAFMSDVAYAGSAGSFDRHLAAGTAGTLLWNMMPRWRTGSVSATVQFAGIDKNAATASIFSPVLSGSSLGGILKFSYSTMRTTAFAPFDSKGVSIVADAEVENMTGYPLALSFASGLTWNIAGPGLPSIRLRAFGAYALPGSLVFLPSGRVFSSKGSIGATVSALPSPYPVFGEYSLIGSGSDWYAFSELRARVFNLEFGSVKRPMEIPFGLGFLARRALVYAGARCAAMASASGMIFPASAFAALAIDFSSLAGLAAEDHIIIYAEAAVRFNPDLAGGSYFYATFSFGADLP
jgi:hypothetical protein